MGNYICEECGSSDVTVNHVKCDLSGDFDDEIECKECGHKWVVFLTE